MAVRFNPLDYPFILTEPAFITDIESWQEHIPFAFFLIEALKPRILVELGSFKGDSYCGFCQAIVHHRTETRAYAVDTWMGDPHAGFYGDEVLDQLRAHHDSRYSGFSRLLRTTFDEAVQHFADGTIDLLHIDGLHTYDAVRHDFETWLPKLSDRGVVVFHDTNVRERDFGVWRLWQEISPRFPAFQFSHGNGLGVLAVGPQVDKSFLAFLAEAANPDSGIKTIFETLGRRVLLSGREKRLSHDVGWMRRDIDRARIRIAEQDYDTDLLRRELEGSRHVASMLRHDLATAVGEREMRDAQIRAIYGSASWRLTRPLRGVLHVLRRLRQGQAGASASDGLQSSPLFVLLRAVMRHAKAVLRDPKRGVAYARRAYQLWRRGGVTGLVVGVKAALRRGVSAPPNLAERALVDSRATRAEMLQRIEAFSIRPKVSIIMPTYNTPVTLLDRAVASVRAQVYENWELSIVDDGSPDPATRQAVEQLSALDARIKVARLEVNQGIAAASNRALENATGEFVAFLDHDDEITEDALFECVSALNAAPDTDVFYSDEDKIDLEQRPSEPFHKPAWSPELFRGVMYVGHFLFARRSLVDQVGRFDSAYDGVQDYELMLRMSERARRIGHIPKILYRWRKVQGSIADSVSAKAGVNLRQVAAVNAQLVRLKIAAEAKAHPELPHRVVLVPQRRDQWPKVSIIIPTKDAPDYIERCLTSIFQRTSYPNFEVIVVDNGTTDPAALRSLEKHLIVKVPFDEVFNFSRANNLGVAAATGDYVVFLNNDTEISTPDWLQNMICLFDAGDVGAVGALLLYPDQSVQHAGVVLGARGTADHVMRGFPATSDGYGGSLACTREVSAVTAACMMMPTALFHEVGGFSEVFRTIYQDVDLCLKVRNAGRRILLTPRAVLIHHESVSRGEAYDLFDRAVLLDAWGAAITAGDPYYSPRLSLERLDYSLAP